MHTRTPQRSATRQARLVNLPGWCWAEIQQFALVGSSSSLHSEACNALGASDGVIHSRISQEVACLRAATNTAPRSAAVPPRMWMSLRSDMLRHGWAPECHTCRNAAAAGSSTGMRDLPPGFSQLPSSAARPQQLGDSRWPADDCNIAIATPPDTRDPPVGSSGSPPPALFQLIFQPGS